MTRENWLSPTHHPAAAIPRLKTGSAVCVATFIWLVCGSATPAAAFDDPLATSFDIESFDSRVTVQGNAEIWVEESIIVLFKKPSEEFVRQLTVYASKSSDADARAVFDHFEAHDAEGGELPIRISRTSKYTRIKIENHGSSYFGRRIYHLRYRMQNAIEHARDHSELNLDVTGIAWRAPIGRARSVVEFKTSTAPAGLVAECATGSLGYDTHDCQAETFADSVVISSTRALREFEGLTTRVRWGNEIVTRPGLWQRLVWKFELDSNWLWLVSIAPLILLYLRLSRIRRQFETAQGNAPIRQLRTFDGRRLSPAEAGLIFAERFDTRDVAATLFDLAAQGALEIEAAIVQSKLEFKFRLQGDNSELLSPLELRILAILRPPGGAREVDISLLTEVLSGERSNLRDLVEGSLIARGYLSSSPSKARLRWALAALLVGGLVAVIGFTFTDLNLALVLVAAFLPAVSVAGFGIKLTNKTTRGIEAFHAIKRFRAYLTGACLDHDSSVLGDNIGSQVGYAIALDAISEWPRIQGKPRNLKIVGLSVAEKETLSPVAVFELTNRCIAILEGAQFDRCFEFSDWGLP